MLFKVVGAERRQIGAIFLTQYAMLGLVAAILGALIGIVTSFVVVRFGLDMSWQAAPLLATAVPIAAVPADAGDRCGGPAPGPRRAGGDHPARRLNASTAC